MTITACGSLSKAVRAWTAGPLSPKKWLVRLPPLRHWRERVLWLLPAPPSRCSHGLLMSFVVRLLFCLPFPAEHRLQRARFPGVLKEHVCFSFSLFVFVFAFLSKPPLPPLPTHPDPLPHHKNTTMKTTVIIGATGGEPPAHHTTIHSIQNRICNRRGKYQNARLMSSNTLK